MLRIRPPTTKAKNKFTYLSYIFYYSPKKPSNDVYEVIIACYKSATFALFTRFIHPKMDLNSLRPSAPIDCL